MTEETKGATRRDVLRMAATGVPVVAAAAVAAPTTAEAAAPEAGTGLRKTAHVEKYLETARF